MVNPAPALNLNDNLCSSENCNEESKEGGRRQSLICGILHFDVHVAVSKTESAFKLAVEKIIHLTSIFFSSNLFGQEKTFADWCESKMSCLNDVSTVNSMNIQKPRQDEEVKYPAFLKTFRKGLFSCPLNTGNLSREDYDALKRRKSETPSFLDKHMSHKTD